MSSHMKAYLSLHIKADRIARLITGLENILRPSVCPKAQANPFLHNLKKLVTLRNRKFLKEPKEP